MLVNQLMFRAGETFRPTFTNADSIVQCDNMGDCILTQKLLYYFEQSRVNGGTKTNILSLGAGSSRSAVSYKANTGETWSKVTSKDGSKITAKDTSGSQWQKETLRDGKTVVKATDGKAK